MRPDLHRPVAVLDVIEITLGIGIQFESHGARMGDAVTVERLVDVGFDVTDDPLNLIVADGPLPTGLGQPPSDLLAFERFADPVLLHDLDDQLIQPLVRRVAALAAEACRR